MRSPEVTIFVKVKAILNERGISQRQLASQLGISAHTFNEKIQGKREFTWSEVSAICGILGIPPCTLM